MNLNLLDKLKEGNESAYRIIFNEYNALLVSFAYKYLKDLDNAREISQKVFVKFFEKRNSIEISSNLKAYLYKMAFNECLNYIKSKKISSDHYSNYAKEFENSADYQHFIEQTEEEYKIYKAIEQLPPRCRQIFKLSRFEEKKNTIIAQELNISIRTVETQISKALRLLKAELCYALVLINLIIR
jgi:RNA polymerase sigma-70 factor (family 1)